MHLDLKFVLCEMVAPKFLDRPRVGRKLGQYTKRPLWQCTAVIGVFGASNIRVFQLIRLQLSHHSQA